jgi:pyrroline-5-carboxylate reductase
VKKSIAIIGCGNMGEAILSGLISKKYIARNRIFASDKSVSRLKQIRKRYRVHTMSSNMAACAMAETIILAIKPQGMEAVLSQITDIIKDRLVISIAAGKTIDFIKRKSRAKRIARAMPNMPALAGCSMTVLVFDRGISKPDMQKVKSIFNCIGKTIVLDERYMDAVTAVSGSGPAYLFLLMEAMTKAAISLGLKKEIAYKLVAQTIYGSSFLQYKLDKCPACLREDVTSRGGTTEAALKVFKKRGFDKIVRQAITAAFKKSKGLK